MDNTFVILLCGALILFAICILRSRNLQNIITNESIENIISSNELDDILTEDDMSDLYDMKDTPKIRSYDPNVYRSVDDFVVDNQYDSGKVYKGEEETRCIFEEIFGREFKTVRLKSLTNPYTGKPLEIDGMCRIKHKGETIDIGFEYQGQQHYEYVSAFHKSRADFEKQIMRDLWKKHKCENLGIIVIEIPYNVEDKREHILSKLSEYPELGKYYNK